MAKKQNRISRVLRPRTQAKAIYDRYSLLYDLISGDFERKYAMAGLKLLDVRPGEYALEIGFGTGHIIKELAKAVGTTGHVWGIDISEGMCQAALRRIQKAQLSDRVTFLCQDALQLPFQKPLFNAIFMSFTLELFDTHEIPLLLRECKRVLHPGGRLAVVSLSKVGRETFLIRIYEWLHQLLPQWLDCRPIFLNRTLESATFNILTSQIQSMFGLPVELVLCQKLS